MLRRDGRAVLRSVVRDVQLVNASLRSERRRVMPGDTGAFGENP